MNKSIALLALIGAGLAVGGCADFGHVPTPSYGNYSGHSSPDNYGGNGYYAYPQPSGGVYYSDWQSQHPNTHWDRRNREEIAGEDRLRFNRQMREDSTRQAQDNAAGQQFNEQKLRADWELKKQQAEMQVRQQQTLLQLQKDAQEYQARQQQAAAQYQVQQAVEQAQQRQAAAQYQQQQQQAAAQYQAQQAATQFQQQQAAAQYEQRKKEQEDREKSQPSNSSNPSAELFQQIWRMQHR